MRTETDRRAARGWMFYDWATQPFHTIIVTFVFAPYFASAVAANSAEGQAIWGYTFGTTGIVIALLAPILGAVTDSSGPRKPWLFGFAIVYVCAVSYLWYAVPGATALWPILLAFALAMIAVECSTSFNNAMLPDIAAPKDVGPISGTGWAFGYIGGLVALALVLALVAENAAGVTLLGHPPIGGLDPAMREGTRSVGPLAAIWFVIFMVPFFLWVPDVPRKAREGGSAIRRGLRELKSTIADLPANQPLLRYLIASMVYRDALAGLFAFGGIYAAGVLGLSVVEVGIFGIISLIGGALGAWIGGKCDRAFGPRPVLIWSIAVLVIVCAMVVTTSRSAVMFMPIAEGSQLPDMIFYVGGALIGAFGGSLQASSRTMLVDLANRDRMTEAFGLFALSGRATAFIAPFAVAFFTDLSGSQQIGITPVVVLFLAGLILLLLVHRGKETI